MKAPINCQPVNLAYSLLAVFLSLLVLFVSVSRASLTIWAQEAREDNLSGKLVSYEVIDSDGNREEGSYRLPEAKTLPDSPFYGFRRVRDWLWLVFSQGDISKAKTSLLLADKKMAEAEELTKESSKVRLIIECGQEALEKLKYSDQLISETNEQNDEWKQLHKQVYTAGLAYYELLENNREMVSDEQEKYDQLIDDLKSWNEKQSKDQETMEV